MCTRWNGKVLALQYCSLDSLNIWTVYSFTSAKIFWKLETAKYSTPDIRVDIADITASQAVPKQRQDKHFSLWKRMIFMEVHCRGRFQKCFKFWGKFWKDTFGIAASWAVQVFRRPDGQGVAGQGKLDGHNRREGATHCHLEASPHRKAFICAAAAGKLWKENNHLHKNDLSPQCSWFSFY